MTKEIINAIGKRQVLRNHPIVAPNISMIYLWEMDLLSVGQGGMAWEFEVKISRGDFLKDKKKKKWEKLTWLPNEKKPNYISYVCPDGLIKENEIPDFAGLYYFKDGEIIEVRHPKLLHSVKADMCKMSEKIARVYSQRQFLGCTLLTHENREIVARNNELERLRKETQEKFMQHCKWLREQKEAATN